MAVQEELAEALEEEDGLEYEDENEVIYHDQDNVEDELQPEVVHHYEESTEQDEQQKNSHAHFSTPDRHSSHAQPREHISVSVPSSVSKQLHFHPDTEQTEGAEHAQPEENTPEDEPPVEGMDDSFAWESMDNKTPKKSTKLLSQIRNFNNTNISGAGKASVSKEGGESSGGASTSNIDAGGGDNSTDNAHSTSDGDINGTNTTGNTFTIEDTGRHTTSPARITSTNNTSSTSKAANSSTTTTTTHPASTVPGKNTSGSAGGSAGSGSAMKQKPLPKETTARYVHSI